MIRYSVHHSEGQALREIDRSLPIWSTRPTKPWSNTLILSIIIP